MKIKRKPVMASSGYNDDTVFVIFRKVRVDGQWVPVAFWYSSGQTLNYGRLYAIMPEFGGYTCEEADMGFYNASKKLTPADPGYDDLKEYTYDWLSDHGDGQGGFKKIVERQRVDYNGLRNSWYRDTIPDDDSVEYSAHSSTDITASTDAGIQRCIDVIADFAYREFGDEYDADQFKDLHDVNIAFTTTAESEEFDVPVQIYADIPAGKLYAQRGDELFVEDYGTPDALADALEDAQFEDLVFPYANEEAYYKEDIRRQCPNAKQIR